MTTGKQLNIQNATVTTATIEVKTLTIGARQVTQGIFKQLIEEPLIAEDGTLNGVPWGHVTWHPDKCDGGREHWHIVWQRGTELRRSTVTVEPHFAPDFWCDEAGVCLDGAVLEWLHGRREKLPLARKYDSVAGAPCSDSISRRTKHGFSVVADPSDTAVAAAKAKLASEEAQRILVGAEARMTEPFGAHRTQEWCQRMLIEARDAVERASEALAKATAELEAELGDSTYQQLSAAMNAATQSEADRRQHQRDIRATLAQLPQLFIGG